jgi:very-short-patch-repair endonuclease
VPSTIQLDAGRQTASAGAWTTVAQLAGRQHGVVSRVQMATAGVSRSSIETALRSGLLHRMHQGVYAVGHPRLSGAGRWSAAVLACGPGAALGYRSAAAHLSLRPSGSRLLEVVTATSRGRTRDGIRVHRHQSLAPDEMVVHDGIRTTTVARTLLDLAAVESAPTVPRAVMQAEAQGWFDLAAILALIGRHPHHRGRTRFLHVLDGAIDLPRSRSPLEDAFPDLCRRAQLPVPTMNATIEGREVDALFRDRGVVVELDSRRYHRGVVTREADFSREAALSAAGWRVLRFTYRQVFRDGGREVTDTLRSVLLQQR